MSLITDSDLARSGMVIVTGSVIRAEEADRPLAYRLKNTIGQRLDQSDNDFPVIVISDLWYLNSVALQEAPAISIGGPGINAVSAHFFKRIPNALMVDNRLLIQLDPELEDLRACIWGIDHALTVNALELFINKGYLDSFLEAVKARH